MSKHPQHEKALRVLFAYPDGIDPVIYPRTEEHCRRCW